MSDLEDERTRQNRWQRCLKERRVVLVGRLGEQSCPRCWWESWRRRWRAKATKLSGIENRRRIRVKLRVVGIQCNFRGVMQRAKRRRGGRAIWKICARLACARPCCASKQCQSTSFTWRSFRSSRPRRQRIGPARDLWASLGSNFEPEGPQLVKICSEPMRMRGYASRALPNLVSAAVAVLNAALFLDLRVIANQLFGCSLVAHAFNLKERASAAHLALSPQARCDAWLSYLDAKNRFINPHSLLGFRFTESR
jgi:hypothetical protein